MKRLVKLQAPRKTENDYPNVSSKDFLDYLMYKTNTDTITELSAKVPFSQAYLNNILNNYTPLTTKFVEKLQSELGFTMDDYKEWLNVRGREDGGRQKVKKRKRNDFDQVGFLKFVEEIANKRAGLKKSDLISLTGISNTLWQNMLNEKAELSNETLKKIDSILGIGSKEYEYYLTDPKNMIDYITSKELQELSKSYHKGEIISKSTGFSKFLEEVTGLSASQLHDELGINPEQAVKREDGKIGIPKNIVQATQDVLGLNFDNYKDYKSNGGDLTRFENDKIKNLKLKYAPEGSKDPKSKGQLKEVDPAEFVNFLMAATNLKATDLSRALGYKSHHLQSMKTSGTKVNNTFLEAVQQKLGLTLEDFYAYQQDPSNLKTVNITPPSKDEEATYNLKDLVDKRRAPSYVDPIQYIEFVVKATGAKITKLSTELGFSHSYVSNIKQGKTPLYMELVKSVQAVYGLTIQDFYMYAQDGTLPQMQGDQEEVEDEGQEQEQQAVIDLSQQSNFLNVVCLLGATNMVGIANATGYSDQDILAIKNQQAIITQDFVDKVNAAFSIDSLTIFNEFVVQTSYEPTGTTDYRGQQETAVTSQ